MRHRLGFGLRGAAFDLTSLTDCNAPLWLEAACKRLFSGYVLGLAAMLTLCFSHSGFGLAKIAARLGVLSHETLLKWAKASQKLSLDCC